MFPQFPLCVPQTCPPLPVNSPSAREDKAGQGEAGSVSAGTGETSTNKQTMRHHKNRQIYIKKQQQEQIDRHKYR